MTDNLNQKKKHVYYSCHKKTPKKPKKQQLNLPFIHTTLIQLN